ncbi:unannotated protein [freshwater metagenome]|uniref:Unannotated protein n=1 Tax=freshwater metagenome TaxID=449393 RepID=A0A6J7JRE9_9ZZZZ
MSMVVAALMLAITGPCPGSTTREVEQCLAARLSRADAELNRYYAAAVARLTRDGNMTSLAKLRASERAWIAYRDAECDAVYDWWQGGTIRGAMTLSCRTRITQARTFEVWRNWLTYVDSTPPVLPRPAPGD